VNIQEIAQLYLKGLKMRAEASEFTHEKLAAKFERCKPTIGKIAKGTPVNLPGWELELIQGCLNERTRLKWEASGLSVASLCYQHKIGHKALEDELIRIGEWEPAA